MKRTVLLAAIALALLGSGSVVVVAEKPSSATYIPLRVTVDGEPGNNPDSYGVVGDGDDYLDGEEGVSALLQEGDLNNDFLMNPSSDRRVSPPRALSFDFFTKIADGTIANPWYGSGMTAIDTYLNFKDVNTVPVGTVQERSGGFGLFPGGKTTYRLAFNPNYATAPNFTLINTPNWTSAVLVDHPDCNTWILTPKTAPYDERGYGSGSGAVSALISGTKSTGQYLMTFRITLTRKTPITCP